MSFAAWRRGPRRSAAIIPARAHGTAGAHIVHSPDFPVKPARRTPVRCGRRLAGPRNIR